MRLLTRRQLAATVGTAVLPLRALGANTQAVLYKDPQCGCCEGHAAYLRQEGSDVDIKEVNNLDQMSRDAGVPDELQGCHLIRVGGYVVEGHFQASTIRRLLRERPEIIGITLPGMPPGTPGMPGTKPGPLQIMAIHRNGSPPTIYDVQ